MGDILDRGSLLFASIAAIVATLALRPPLPFYMPLLVLAVVYVPGLLFLGNLLGRLGSFGAVLQRDYSPLLTLHRDGLDRRPAPDRPRAVDVAPCRHPDHRRTGVSLLRRPRVFRGADGLRQSNGASAGIVALSWIPLAAAVLLREPLSMLFGLLASPFFLFFAIYYLGV